MQKTFNILTAGLLIITSTSCQEHECEENSDLCGDRDLSTITILQNSVNAIKTSIPGRTNRIPYQIKLTQTDQTGNTTLKFSLILPPVTASDDLILNLNLNISPEQLKGSALGSAMLTAETVYDRDHINITKPVIMYRNVLINSSPISYMFSSTVTKTLPYDLYSPQWLGIDGNSLYSLQSGISAADGKPYQVVRQLMLDTSMTSLTLGPSQTGGYGYSDTKNGARMTILDSRQIIALPFSTTTYNIYECPLGSQTSACLMSQSIPLALNQPLTVFLADPNPRGSYFIASENNGPLQAYQIQGATAKQVTISSQNPMFPITMAVFADINGDGYSDVIGLRKNDSTAMEAAIYLGTAGDLVYDSILSAKLTSVLPAGSISAVATGDIDGNMQPDLIFAHDGKINILLHNGNTQQPSFFENTSLALDTKLSIVDALAVGDLNSDKLPDIAVANSAANTVAVYLQMKSN